MVVLESPIQIAYYVLFFIMLIVGISCFILIGSSLVSASSDYSINTNIVDTVSNSTIDLNILSKYLTLKLVKPLNYEDVHPYVIVDVGLDSDFYTSYNPYHIIANNFSNNTLTNYDITANSITTNNINTNTGFASSDSILNSINFSSYYDLVVYVYLNGETNKYVYNDLLLFPIEFDIATKGKYIFMLVDKSDQSIVSQVEFLPEENFNWELTNVNIVANVSSNNANNLLNLSNNSDSLIADSSNSSSNNSIITNVSDPIFNNLESLSNVIDSSSLTLDSTVLAAVVLDKLNYSINEPVNVIITNKVSDETLPHTSLIIYDGVEMFKYVGTQRESIFIPARNGTYTLVLKNDLSNEIIFSSEFFVKSADTSSENVVEVLSEYRRMSVTDSKGASLFGNINVNDVRIEQKDIQVVEKGFFKNTVKTFTQDVQVAKKANIDLNGVKGFDTAEISFNNLELSNTNLDLKLDHVTPNLQYLKKDNFAESKIIESYAMDLSTLNFDNGTFTRIAKGTMLWKCKDWDYEKQYCMGTWVKIQDISPGQEYTIEISPVDPGYMETGVTTINTVKPIYHPFETAQIMIAALDITGLLVSDANIILDVISPDNIVTTFSTDRGNIIELTNGIYSASYVDTGIEGNYTMNVRAIKYSAISNDTTTLSSTKILDSSMSSHFTVLTNYDFDILRNTPMSIDPFKGPMYSSINVVPYINLSSYNFTEVLPSDFVVVEAQGATVYTDELLNKTYLQWSNLNGNSSVDYVAQAPLITPNLYALGKSFITYIIDGVTKVFEEARNWFVVVDPEVSTDDGMLVYFTRPIAEQGLLKYRNWTNDLMSTQIVTTTDSGNDNIQWVKFRCLDNQPTCLQANNDNANDLNWAYFNSSSWTWSANTQLSGATMIGQQSFDIECEDTLTGRCLLAYEDGTGNNAVFNYRLWTTSLSGATAVTVTGAENFPFTWIKMYPKKNSNIIGIVLQNQGAAAGVNTGTPAIYAGIWDGTGFSNWKNFTLNAPTNGNNNYVHQRHFDCAWEAGSGKLFCVYANDSQNAIYGIRFNGTGWEDLGSIYNNMTEPWEFALCGQEPSSNFNHSYIGLMTCDSLSDLDGGYWNGTAFSKTMANQTPVKNPNAECGIIKAQTEWGQNFQCKFENSGDQIVYGWVSSGTDTWVTTGIYTKSTNSYTQKNWTTGIKVVASGNGVLRTLGLASNPFNDQIFLTYTNQARDGGCSLWRGTVWDGSGCNNAQVFEAAGSQAGTVWLTFDWFRQRLEPYITIIMPQVTTGNWNYEGDTTGGQPSAAYKGNITQLPPNAANSPINGTEFTSPEYYAVSYLDDDLWTQSQYIGATPNMHTFQSFKFYITDPAISVSQLKLKYEGYALRGNVADDYNIYVYNWNTDAYELKKLVFGGGGGDMYSETYVSDSTGAMTNYIRNNTAYFLIENVEPRSATYPNLTLYTNYISLETEIMPVLRLNATVNATAVDVNNVSRCWWSFFNTTGSSINGNTSMSYNNITGYYINITDTRLVADNNYNLYVFCNDTLNNVRNSSVRVRVDNTAPSIILIAPNNSANITVNYAIFSWNATDNVPLENMRCNVTIDGVIKSPYNVVSPEKTIVSQNITGIVDGTHYWNVTCIDDAGNVNTSVTRSFDSDTAGPIISLLTPDAGSFKNNIPLDVNFSATDTHNVVNCSLYLDNVLNYTYINLTSGVAYNITYSNLNQGLHRWNVTCYDSFNYRTNSLTRNFTYDITAPTVYLNATSALFNGTIPRLNYTVYDNIDRNSTCNITVEDVVVDPNIPSGNGTLNSRSVSLLDGWKTWYVTCWDDAGNVNVSTSGLFRVIGGPFVNLTSPANGTVNNGSNITFNYYTRDGDGVANCSLYINGVLNQTNSTLPGSDTGINSSFFINDFSQGIYNWYISCYDNNGMDGLSQNFTLTSDRSSPNIALSAPTPGQMLTATPARFNFTLTDAYSSNATCNLTIDSVISAVNRNFNVINGSLNSKTEIVSNGIHYWNITCVDRGNNFATSATQNFTMNVTFPISVTVVANKIIYQENEIVHINTTMRNDTSGLMATNLTLDYIYTNNTFTDLPWWNTSFTKRRPIYINETQNKLRTQRPISLNLTFEWGDISSCNNLRIIDDVTLTPVAYNYLGVDSTTTCNLIFNATVSANAVNEQNYHVYFGNKSLVSSPGYPNLLAIQTLFSDTFAAGVLAPNWIGGTNWNVLNNNPVGLGFGNNAHVNGVVTNSTATLNKTLPISLFDNVNISFVWRIDTWTAASTFIFEYSNNSGSTWTGGLGVAYLTGTGDNDVNRNFAQNLNSTYLNDAFGLRFRVISTVAANDAGFDNFNISAYNTIAINVSTRVGDNQIFIERLVNSTNTTGVFNTNWTTLGRDSGNYSAAVYATTSNTKFRPGSGYDWFTPSEDKGGNKPRKMAKSVLFPQPLSPIKAMRCPLLN